MTLAQQQVHHHEEMIKHTHLLQFHETSGDIADLVRNIQVDRALLTKDRHEKGKLFAAASHNGDLALKHYEAAQYHNAQITHHHQLASGRRR